MKKLLSLLLSLCLGLSLVLPASALEAEDAKELLRTYYVDPLPDGFDGMTSLEELLAAIHDPYTVYLPPKSYTSLMDSIDGGTVVGIGATIRRVYEDGYRILSILPDSPALDAGLQPGDVILAVDGSPLTGDIDPTTRIMGEEGTSVTLTILRQGTGLPQDLTLIRRAVEVPIVLYEKQDSALFITCDSFGSSTAGIIAKALLSHEAQSSTVLMDLRSNPGGTSQAAAGAAGLFLGGEIISYFRDASGEYDYIYTLPNYPDLTDKPLIILTSPQSASGSEMFSAAIRDYGAGIAVGERTFGKGVGQYLFDENTHPGLFDGDCLKITVFRFYSPEGATNDTVGVLPTLMVSPEYTQPIALLLSAPLPASPVHHLKVEIAGQTLCVDLEQALKAENTAALTQLLEALPPSARLYETGPRGTWVPVSPAGAADHLGLSFTPRSFSDLEGSPFREQIETLAAYRLLSGYEDGSFRPGQIITRAEFCAMTAAALDLPAPAGGSSFSDVSSQDWFAGAVNAMAARGFLSGGTGGAFRPGDPITHQEVASILSNLSVWACMDGYAHARQELTDQDRQTYAAYSPWAQAAARNLDLLGALDASLAPQEYATRASAAGMLCGLLRGAGMLWE